MKVCPTPIKGSLTSILRNPSPERKPTKKPTKAELSEHERKEKASERGRKREKKYVSTMEVPIRGGSASPNRHFYQDEEYFKDGRIAKGSKGLNIIENSQKGPELPDRPPVTAEMLKMSEIQDRLSDDRKKKRFFSF